MTAKDIRLKSQEFFQTIRTKLRRSLEGLSERQKRILILTMFSLLALSDIWMLVRGFSGTVPERLEYIEPLNMRDDDAGE